MNRKNTAVIICNYNGGTDTVNCINSVLASCYKGYDIYVIDNASTDGSAERIGRQFGSLVTVVSNPENLGGSGGFGRGLRLAVEKGYSYIMMLDNDAYVDADTLDKLHTYLQDNPEVGIVGAKIMMADDPRRIMDYAKVIDFKNFTDGSEWWGQPDSEEASVPRECDYVAATASMVRREALLACGGMDEDFFIYYDDIELAYRIKQSGRRVVSLGTAKAWHKSSMCHKTTDTFVRYYLTRNRYRFFAKYMPEEEIERFAETILQRAFTYMYGSWYNGRKDIFDTEKYILEDFIRDRRGKAGERRVNELQRDGYHRIEEAVKGSKSVLIHPASEVSEHCVVRLCDGLLKVDPDTRITISTAGGMEEKAESCIELIKDSRKKEGKICADIRLAEKAGAGAYDKTVHFCSHVKEIRENILPAIYIDPYNNLIADEQDYIYFRNYDNSYAFFKGIYHDSVIETIHKIRKEKTAWK